MTADLRLWPAAGAVWTSTAVVLAVRPSAAVCAITAIAGGLLIAVAVSIAPRLRSLLGRSGIAVLALALAASAIATGVRVSAVDAALLPDPGTQVQARGLIDSDPQRVSGRVAGTARAPDQARMSVTLTSLRWEGGGMDGRVPGQVWAPVSALGLLPGTSIAFDGQVRPSRSEAEVVVGSRSPPVVIEEAPSWQRAAGAMRQGLQTSVHGLAGDGAALLPALVLGDTSDVPDELADAMRQSGLAHLTAVSGANVSIVLLAVLGVGGLLRVRGRARAVLAGLALAGFLVLVRPSPSVVRATAMGAVVVVALLIGGRRRGPPALAAATIVLLLLDPLLAVSLGFALSVAATAALLVLAPRIADAAVRRRVPPWLAQASAVTVAAQLATAPLLVLIGAPVGLGAIPANLLAELAVAPATLTGLAATLAAPVWPGAARALAVVGVGCAQWIASVARTVAHWAPLTIPWPAGVGGAAAAAAVGVCCAVAWRQRRRIARWPRAPLAAGSAALVVAAAAIPTIAPVPWPPPGWVAVACDVGQGDAIAVRAQEGSAVVVDAGPDPGAVGRCLDDLGITHVPALVLTHFHADHVEGVPGVLRGRDVRSVLVSPLADPVDEVARVSAWCAAAGLAMTAVTTGDERAVGQLRWRVLWPSRLVRAEGSAPNNASVTLRVEVGGVSLLLGGDLEPAAQSALLAETSSLTVDVVKVPHHGSRRQHPRLASTVAARAALISVGASNRYGHPAAETIAAYEAAGTAVWRTDRNGDVAVVVGESGLSIVARTA